MTTPAQYLTLRRDALSERLTLLLQAQTVFTSLVSTFGSAADARDAAKYIYGASLVMLGARTEDINRGLARFDEIVKAATYNEAKAALQAEIASLDAAITNLES